MELFLFHEVKPLSAVDTLASITRCIAVYITCEVTYCPAAIDSLACFVVSGSSFKHHNYIRSNKMFSSFLPILYFYSGFRGLRLAQYTACVLVESCVTLFTFTLIRCIFSVCIYRNHAHEQANAICFLAHSLHDNYWYHAVRLIRSIEICLCSLDELAIKTCIYPIGTPCSLVTN